MIHKLISLGCSQGQSHFNIKSSHCENLINNAHNIHNIVQNLHEQLGPGLGDKANLL